MVLKLTLQRQTWDQRPCSRLVDAFLTASATVHSQGGGLLARPRAARGGHRRRDELVLTDAAGATITADEPVSTLTKGAAGARGAAATSKRPLDAHANSEKEEGTLVAGRVEKADRQRSASCAR